MAFLLAACSEGARVFAKTWGRRDQDKLGGSGGGSEQGVDWGLEIGDRTRYVLDFPRT